MNQLNALPVADVTGSFAVSTNGLFNASTVTMYDMQPISLESVSGADAVRSFTAVGLLDDAELTRKVVLLINLSHACRVRVPELLAREAAILSASDFARLMKALEKHSEYSFEDERFYVFLYPNGVVGSVWLFGDEVYASPRHR
ncbi:MAG: hypothetical protein K2Y39_17545 [Candidatus Obscuribacterales bacterium]|nr:hypothetical protein [Candidatus Obscuribacterales bacterium]